MTLEIRDTTVYRGQTGWSFIPATNTENDGQRLRARHCAARRLCEYTMSPGKDIAMREPEPAIQTMTISDVRNKLSSLVNEIYRNETRVLVEKSGIPVAALVSAGDLERLQRLDAEWRETTRSLLLMSEAFADVPVEELEAKIDEIIAEGRIHDVAERRSA